MRKVEELRVLRLVWKPPCAQGKRWKGRYCYHISYHVCTKHVILYVSIMSLSYLILIQFLILSCLYLIIRTKRALISLFYPLSFPLFFLSQWALRSFSTLITILSTNQINHMKSQIHEGLYVSINKDWVFLFSNDKKNDQIIWFN